LLNSCPEEKTFRLTLQRSKGGIESSQVSKRNPDLRIERVSWRPRRRLSVSWKGRGASRMAKAKEFTVTIEDKPGALGKCFLALAERGVNILAFQSYVEERESLVRFLVDDPASAETVLGSLRMNFEEIDVAVVRLAHRPGELGRAASRLGEKQINIDYSYCGLEPGSTLGLLVFGVDNLTKAATLLDELAAEDG
jgi:hypothetical protein